MRRAWWLVLLVAPAFAQDDAALRAVEACRARLDPKVDVGIERVQRRCPELLPALTHAPWKDLMPRALTERREEISAESLRALIELVRAAQAGGAQREPPSAEALAPVLAELGDLGKQGATRWDRFKRWLKQKLEDENARDQAGWLERWTRELSTSEGIARALTYAGYAMVLALVLFVVWSELRAAGLIGGPGRAARAAAAAEWRRRLMLADVAEAPLAERPGMLLKLLGEALTRTRRLPAAAGLTASAMARRARIEETDRAELAHVARVAEKVRYAPRTPPEPEIADTVDTARVLLGRIANLPVEKG